MHLNAFYQLASLSISTGDDRLSMDSSLAKYWEASLAPAIREVGELTIVSQNIRGAYSFFRADDFNWARSSRLISLHSLD